MNKLFEKNLTHIWTIEFIKKKKKKSPLSMSTLYKTQAKWSLLFVFLQRNDILESNTADRFIQVCM